MRKNHALSLIFAVLFVFAACGTSVSAEWVIYDSSTPGTLPYNYINDIVIENPDTAWIATDGSGIAKFDGTAWTIYSYPFLLSDRANVITIDGSGTKWFGTSAGLVKYDGSTPTYYTPSNSGIPGENIYALAIDGSSNIWVGIAYDSYPNEDGLVKFDGVSTWTVYNSSNPPAPTSDNITSIAIDGSNNVWAGERGFLSSGGLGKFNGTSWTHYTYSNSDIPSNNVNAVVLDGTDVWVGTNTQNGLYTGGAAMFDGLAWTHYNTGNSSLPDDGVNAILVDAGGRKWFGTDNGGLAMYNDSFWMIFDSANSPLPNNTVMTIAEDAGGTKWIGTYGGGVAAFTPASLTCTYAIYPITQTITQYGDLSTIDVTAGTNCAWQVQSSAPWLTAASGNRGVGSGVIDLAVNANIGLARIGTITVTGSTNQVSTVYQPAGSAADLNNGLIGYWRFNNCTAADASGNGQNGTLYGSPSCVNGKMFNAYLFNGSTQYISVPDNPVQQIDTNALTAAAWVWLTSDIGNTQQRIINKQEDNGITWGLEISGSGYNGATGNNVTFHDSEGILESLGGQWTNCVATTTNLTPGTWYHVAATDDGGNIKVYVNGVLENNCIDVYGIPSNISSDIAIARHAGGGFNFDGAIDEVVLYNRALSSSEITELMNATQSTTGFGSISGTVTAAATGNPVENAEVELYDLNYDWIDSTYTDAAGNYLFSDIPSGRYKVHFISNDMYLANQWYKGEQSYSSAGHVAVVNAVTTANIDAELERGRVITGTVTNPGGSPVNGLRVEVYSAENDDFEYWLYEVSNAYTDAGGNYTATGLPQGNFKVLFNGHQIGYADEWYSGQAGFCSADMVSLIYTLTQTGINAQLEAGVTLSGRVIDASTGNGAAGVTVAAFLQNEHITWLTDTTDAGGNYSISNLRPVANYVIGFFGENSWYVSEWYQDKPDYYAADYIAITGPTAITETVQRGGTIQGQVTNAGSAAIEDVEVAVYDTSYQWISYGHTGTDGTYTVRGIPPGGQYKVAFFAQGLGYQDEWYNNQTDFSAATLVSVPSLITVTGIDAQLEHLASISGRVTNGSTGIPDVEVVVYDQYEDDIESDVTDASGYYTIQGIPSGSYKIFFNGSSDAGYVNKWYNNAGDFAGAFAVPVTAPVPVTNIDAVLAQGGGIRGTITNAGAEGIGGIIVDVYEQGTGKWVSDADSDPDGSYYSDGIPNGTYNLKFNGGYSGYANAWLSGVSVTAPGTTTGHDKVLALGGTITGTVSNSDGDPVGYITVEIYDAACNLVARVETDECGFYVVDAVPAGSSKVFFNGSDEGYDDAWYGGGSACAGAPASVTVAAQNITGGIHVVLTGGTGTTTTTIIPGGSSTTTSAVSSTTTAAFSSTTSAGSSTTTTVPATTTTTGGGGGGGGGTPTSGPTTTPTTIAETTTIQPITTTVPASTSSVTPTTTSSLPGGVTAGFSATPRSGFAPLTVNFINTASGDVQSYLWGFGDGETSTEENPAHTYRNVGQYTVTLTVTGTGKTDTKTAANYITVQKPPLAAEFTASPVGGQPPLNVSFTDLSTGDITGWSWDFGDGSTSSDQNSSHSYEQAGTYTVTLYVTGSEGTKAIIKKDLITVSQEAVQADFTGSPTSGTGSVNVQFTSTSSGTIASYRWSFGDGGTSTEQNPSHNYTTAGTYTVCLAVKGADGIESSMCRERYITVNERPLVDATISGTVSGDAKEGVQVFLNGMEQQTVTDSQGAYRFTGVGPGTHLVTPLKEGMVFEPQSKSVGVAGLNVSGVDFKATAVKPAILEARSSSEKVPADGVTPVVFVARVYHAQGAGYIASVVINLGVLGGSTQQKMYDDGTNGDETPGDGIYSFSAKVPAGTPPQQAGLVVTAMDTKGQKDNKAINVTIVNEVSGTAGQNSIYTYILKNRLKGQTLVLRYQQTGSGGQSSKAGGNIRIETAAECSPYLEILRPDGTSFLKTRLPITQVLSELEIKGAMVGDWTYRVVNECTDDKQFSLKTSSSGTALLSGMVVDGKTGNGIGGVSVTTDGGGEGTADDTGFYTMIHPAGSFTVEASEETYGSAAKNVTLEAGAMVEADLTIGEGGGGGGGGGGCGATQALGNDTQKLNMLRAFRDKVLMKTDTGAKYVSLYYKHSPEVVQMLKKDGGLQEELKGCIMNLLPVVLAMSSGNEARLMDGKVKQLVGILEKLQVKGSGELQHDIAGLIKELKEKTVIKQITQK